MQGASHQADATTERRWRHTTFPRHGELTGQVNSKPVDSDSATEGSAAEEESEDVGPSQQRAFDLVKDEPSKTPVLVLYDPNRETTS